MRVDFTSFQSLEITDADDNYQELIFEIDLKMTTAGSPPNFNMNDGGDPGWEAEYEIVQVGVDNKDVNTVWTPAEFEFFLGSDIVNRMLDAAILDAHENHVEDDGYDG